jgi:hypothetical protein
MEIFMNEKGKFVSELLKKSVFGFDTAVSDQRQRKMV